MRVRVVGILVGALALACEVDTEGGQVLSECQPLEVETPDIALAEVIGAGQDSQSTVYVIDEAGGELRAFISERGMLQRQRVSGSGQGNVDGSFTTVTLGELDPPLLLQFTVDLDGTERMGIATGPLSTKTFQIGEQGEELTLLPVAAVTAMPLQNYPADVEVEYAAEVEGERLLVVLRPRDLLDYTQFRLFFGPAQRLAERAVGNVSRALDGGSTTIDFEVDGQNARAEFPVELVGETFEPGEPSLTIDDAAFDITLSARSEGASGARYYCR